MSEQKLREFGAQAEELVTLPAFSELDRRGGALRRRRIATVAGLAACVLTVIGIVVAQYDPPKAAEPIRPPDEAPAEARPYPGAVMETLEGGRYELRPAFDSHGARARITVPDGWNAWEGPNKFGNLATPGQSNEEALSEATWYAGLLVLHVEAVASRPCHGPDTGDEVGDSAEALVAAITRIPEYQVTLNEEESPDKFGYPATHLRLRPTPALEECREDFNVFQSAGNPEIAGGSDLRDTWVVDVDGQAIVVAAGADANTPPAVVRELDAMVESIEFYFPEPPDVG